MILELRNVDYYYKDNKSKKILSDINIGFEERKMYAVLGPSGSGKTTFLSLLAGLDIPVKGEILYDGENILRKGLNFHRRNNVSLVFQNYNLIDYLTPKENVRLGGNGEPEKLLFEVGITKEEGKRNVLQLSGGQQQRVAIARALASNSKVLLADEPTGNLDEQTAYEIVALLKKSAHMIGKCVIVVTHSKELAKQADEVIKIKNGNIELVNYEED